MKKIGTNIFALVKKYVFRRWVESLHYKSLVVAQLQSYTTKVHLSNPCRCKWGMTGKLMKSTSSAHTFCDLCMVCRCSSATQISNFKIRRKIVQTAVGNEKLKLQKNSSRWTTIQTGCGISILENRPTLIVPIIVISRIVTVSADYGSSV